MVEEFFRYQYFSLRFMFMADSKWIQEHTTYYLLSSVRLNCYRSQPSLNSPNI